MPTAPTQEVFNQEGRLANIDSKGTVPKSRLSTADSARSMLANLVRGDNVAGIVRTRIQNMIDGASPFSDDDMKKANQGWRARVNWGGARSKIRDYKTAYSDLLNSPDSIVTIQVRAGDPNQRQAYGDIFADRFHDLLYQSRHDWDFVYEMMLHQSMLAIHGVGPCFWPDKRDWRFRACKRRNIQVPRESPSTTARLPIVFIRDAMYVDEVFEHIQKGKGQASGKWRYGPCVKAIQHAQKRDKDKFSFESMQEKWMNNAWDWSYNESDMVLVAHVFVKEFGGRVSHQIFTENGAYSGDKETMEDGYLFSDIGVYDNMNQGVWVCFQDVGNGDFESVRGLGKEAYHFGEAQNRLNNALIDNAIIGSAPLLKCDTPEHANKISRIQVGPFHVLPPGVDVVVANMGTALQATLAAAQHFTELEANTTGIFRTRAAENGSNQARTATEVQAEIGETSKLTNANVSHYLGQADLLVDGTFHRVTYDKWLPSDPGGTEALEFKANCIADGIPEELFYVLAKTAIVKIARPVGNGSYADRISRLSRIGQFIGDMPQRKRAVYVRDCIAQIGGYRELADKYGPDLEQQFPGIEQSIAILENNGFMGGGQQDPFSPDNDHILHLQTHMPVLQQLTQGQQMPPEQAAPIAQLISQHCAEHVQALENDPTRKNEFKQYEAALGEMQNDVKRINRLAQINGSQPPQPPPPDPAVIKAQGEVQTQQMVAQAGIQRDNEKAKQHLAINDAKTAQELEHNRLKTQQELDHNRATTEANLRSQKLTDQAMLENQKKKNGAKE